MASHTDETPVGTISASNLIADVYAKDLPGEFDIVYHDAAGKILEEAPLTGVSSYRQRESEIRERLQQLSEGAHPGDSADLASAGEY